MTANIIGWLGTICFLIAFIPQSIKVLRTKSAEGVSKITYPTVFFGSAIWTLYAALTISIQALICNLSIVILMLPTIYYIFQKNLKIFFIIATFCLAISFASVIIFSLVQTSIMKSVGVEWVNWLFVAIAGAATTLSYIPQLLNIIKTGDIKNISVLTLAIVAIGNILWLSYWLLKYSSDGVGTYLFAAIWSCLGFIWQLPVIWIYIKKHMKIRCN